MLDYEQIASKAKQRLLQESNQLQDWQLDVLASIVFHANSRTLTEDLYAQLQAQIENDPYTTTHSESMSHPTSPALLNPGEIVKDPIAERYQKILSARAQIVANVSLVLRIQADIQAVANQHEKGIRLENTVYRGEILQAALISALREIVQAHTWLIEQDIDVQFDRSRLETAIRLLDAALDAKLRSEYLRASFN